MNRNIILISGSLGLIGFESTLYFLKRRYRVIGIDNNFRQKALGIKTNYDDKLKYLQNKFSTSYIHYPYNLCDNNKIDELFQKNTISSIIHTAGQTSHDWATNNAVIDCKENIIATLNLLELARKYSPKAPFIYTSTNKVYGLSLIHI